MIVELIDDFFEEYPAGSGESDTIDPDEVVTAIAKTVAGLTCSQDGAIRLPADFHPGVRDRLRAGYSSKKSSISSTIMQ